MIQGPSAGLSGLLVGAAVGKVADAIGKDVTNAIAGGKPVEADKAASERAAAIRDELIKAIKDVFQRGTEQREPIRSAASRARERLRTDESISNNQKILEWAEGQKAHVEAMTYREGLLWKQMLHRWVGLVAKGPRGGGQMHKEACQTLFGGDSLPHSEVWRFNLRKTLDAMGLDGTRAFSVPAPKPVLGAGGDGMSSESTGLIEYENARDPAVFAQRWGGTPGSPRHAHLERDGTFLLVASFTTMWRQDFDARWYVDLMRMHYALDLKGQVPNDCGETQSEDMQLGLPFDERDRGSVGAASCTPHDPNKQQSGSNE